VVTGEDDHSAETAGGPPGPRTAAGSRVVRTWLCFLRSCRVLTQLARRYRLRQTLLDHRHPVTRCLLGAVCWAGLRVWYDEVRTGVERLVEFAGSVWGLALGLAVAWALTAAWNRARRHHCPTADD